MPYLTVTGEGSWRPTPGVVFEAGIHEVSAEFAAQARASGIPWLVVTANPPLIAQKVPGAVLTPDDIRIGSPAGTQLAPPEPDTEAPVAARPNLWEIPLDYHCPYCPDPFPTKGSLDRHVERHHEVQA